MIIYTYSKMHKTKLIGI